MHHWPQEFGEFPCGCSLSKWKTYELVWAFVDAKAKVLLYRWTHWKYATLIFIDTAHSDARMAALTVCAISIWKCGTIKCLLRVERSVTNGNLLTQERGCWRSPVSGPCGWALWPPSSAGCLRTAFSRSSFFFLVGNCLGVLSEELAIPTSPSRKPGLCGSSTPGRGTRFSMSLVCGRPVPRGTGSTKTGVRGGPVPGGRGPSRTARGRPVPRGTGPSMTRVHIRQSPGGDGPSRTICGSLLRRSSKIPRWALTVVMESLIWRWHLAPWGTRPIRTVPIILSCHNSLGPCSCDSDHPFPDFILEMTPSFISSMETRRQCPMMLETISLLWPWIWLGLKSLPVIPHPNNLCILSPDTQSHQRILRKILLLLSRASCISISLSSSHWFHADPRWRHPKKNKRCSSLNACKLYVPFVGCTQHTSWLSNNALQWLHDSNIFKLCSTADSPNVSK